MKFLKKSLACLLALGCIGALGACGGGDKGPVETDYTVALSLLGGEAIGGVEISLVQGETEIATGTTDENGQFSGVALEGNYVVELGLLPEEYGYLMNYDINVSLSKNDSVIEIEIGSSACPRLYVPNDYGEMEVSLPASTTHFYSIPRPMGRPLILEEEGIEVYYAGNTYSPENGKISVAFESDPSNTYAVETVGVANKTDGVKNITFSLYEKPGSSPSKPIKVVALDETLTTTIALGKLVYYAWTATGNGTVTVTSSSAGNELYLYNNTTNEATENLANSVSLTVAEGEVVLIWVGLDKTVTAEETEIQFMVSFTETVLE